MRDIDPDQLHKLEETARVLGRILAQALDEVSGPKKTGFCLMLFAFEGPELTYSSNARRQGMIKALDEFRQWLKDHTDNELSRRG